MNRLISTPASQVRQFRRQIAPPAPAADPHPYHILWHHQILDPSSDIVNLWNYVFLISCLLALFIDPLYFYIPRIGGTACLEIEKRPAVLITVFRTLADLSYLLHMLMKFRTAFVHPKSRVFGRGELVMDPKEIAKRYLKTDFIIDLAATLPLPQLVIWVVIPATRNSRVDHNNNTLALIVLLQYIPRVFVIYPLNQQIVRSTGLIARTAWAGAVYNLLLYILASHLMGATWYLLAVGREFQCWEEECANESSRKVVTCLPSFLDCASKDQPQRIYWLNVTKVAANCDPNTKNIKFKFGMFSDAITSGVAEQDFINKSVYSLWWGLRHLSSYGQNLATSTYIGETTFCLLINLVGLILFAQLIGKMQTYLSSMTLRIEEWRIKKRDTEEWMRHRQLPPNLQERVRRFVQYKWLVTRGVNAEAILQELPPDLRRQIQQHLCLSLVRRVPFFSQMDDQLLDAMCERLVSSLCTEGTFIYQEGEPVDEMLFIIRGQLESSTTNGGRAGFFHSITLRPGDFCGEELLTWALMPAASPNMPLSTRTVRAVKEVEAFALRSEDLKYVANQFKRLHSRKLQHAFRYYSHQWRTWGGCFLQSAWRRYKKRKMAKKLAAEESEFYDEESDYDDEIEFEEDAEGSGGSSSRGVKMSKLAKPDEPDFTVDKDDDEIVYEEEEAGLSASERNRSSGGSSSRSSGGSTSSVKLGKLAKPVEPDFTVDKGGDEIESGEEDAELSVPEINRSSGSSSSSSGAEMEKLELAKPVEPDFAVDEDDA